jgi:hypothetical protein
MAAFYVAGGQKTFPKVARQSGVGKYSENPEAVFWWGRPVGAKRPDDFAFRFIFRGFPPSVAGIAGRRWCRRGAKSARGFGKESKPISQKA